MAAQVLVLNASREPLHICSRRRAVVLMYKGKAVAIEHKGAEINGVAGPSVIMLCDYVRIPYTKVALNRSNVLHRDNYTCQYCGVKRNNLTLDHVLPRCRGGRDTWENLVAACNSCNERKGHRLPREAGMTLFRRPVRPNNRLAFEVSKHCRRKYGAGWLKYLEQHD